MLCANRSSRYVLVIAFASGLAGACSDKEADKEPAATTAPAAAKTAPADAAVAKPVVVLPPDAAPPSSPPRKIKVQVLSATTRDKAVAGAQVFLQKDGYSSVEVATDKRGKAVAEQMFGVDDATVSLIVKKEGFSPLVVSCPCDGMSYAISKTITQLESFRVVLNWGKKPRDLDLHVVYPGNHINFRKMKGKDANLDVDDTTSYGPETATIVERHPGEKYVFAVHDFSAEGKHGQSTLARSQAKVMVYVGQSLIRSYYVPVDKKGELWVLFGVDGDGAFRDIDNVVDVSDAKTIGPYMKQLTDRADWGFPIRTSRVASEQAKELSGQGQAALDGGRVPQAIDLFRKAIEADRNAVDAYRGLASAYKSLSRDAEAAWASRKATELASLAPTTGYRVPNDKITLTASSVLGNWKHYTFAGANLIDDNLWSSWQPVRTKGGGVDEWVLMTFSTPQTVTGFEFSNGFRRLDELGDLYVMNNRIEDALLQLSDGTELAVHFEDTPTEQMFMLPAPVACEWVKVVVKKVYKGTKWNDLAVSEFHALAKE